MPNHIVPYWDECQDLFDQLLRSKTYIGTFFCFFAPIVLPTAPLEPTNDIAVFWLCILPKEVCIKSWKGWMLKCQWQWNVMCKWLRAILTLWQSCLPYQLSRGGSDNLQHSAHSGKSSDCDGQTAYKIRCKWGSSGNATRRIPEERKQLVEIHSWCQ